MKICRVTTDIYFDDQVVGSLWQFVGELDEGGESDKLDAPKTITLSTKDQGDLVYRLAEREQP